MAPMMTIKTLAATERKLRELRFAFDIARNSRTATAAEREALLAEIRETVTLRNTLEAERDAARGATPVAPYLPNATLQPASRKAAQFLAEIGK